MEGKMNNNPHLEDSIIQNCPDEPEIPWFQVPRCFIRNPNLSLEAKGLMTYLMSHHENFNISIPWVIKTQKISKNKMYRILNECIEEGYLKRETYLERGKKRYRYLISKTGRFKKYLLCPQKQDTEKQDTENGDAKLDQSLKLDQYKEEEGEGAKRPPPLAAPPNPKKKKEVEEKIEVAPHVFLTPSQENALKTRLNGQNIELKALYLKLSDWKIGKQNFRSKSDYLTIVNWVIDAVRADKQGSSKPIKENNIEFCKKIAERFPEKIKSGDIYVGYKYVDFNFGQRIEQVGFEENGFKEQCINLLRKMNLPVDGL